MKAALPTTPSIPRGFGVSEENTMPNYNAGLNSSDSRFKAIDTDEKLASKVIGTRYPLDVDFILQGMSSGERQALIREAVKQKLVSDGRISEGLPF